MLREGMGTTGGERMEALPGATRTRRRPGIAVLADVAGRESDASGHAPCPDAGLGEHSGRRFLMHTSDENCVQADLPVRVFVVRSFGRANFSVSRAESLAREVAHERLLISAPPRPDDPGAWRRSRSATEETSRGLRSSSVAREIPGR